MTPIDFRRFVRSSRTRKAWRRSCSSWAATISVPTPGASCPRHRQWPRPRSWSRSTWRMSCADDPVPLPEPEIAARAVRLCLAAEQAWRDAPDRGEPPVYVIGTEVPVPGGAHEDLDELAVTSPEAAGATLALHREAFGAAGLEAAFERVIAMVVQPGVDFDHHKVIDYRPEKARALSAFIAAQPGLVFEAHSTITRPPITWRSWRGTTSPSSRSAPARPSRCARRCGRWPPSSANGWAASAAAIRAGRNRAGRDARRARALEALLPGPGAAGGRPGLQPERPHPLLLGPSGGAARLRRMLDRLEHSPPPLTLLSQFLPRQYDAIRDGRLRNRPAELLRDGAAQSLRPYLDACAA
ncbi:tagatose 6 phosphate kinase domain-containing protein [Ditylenchus destructor]|nr:tagatose 6 phosphate kinase domain-containing protein [Ditylenchus destructor]